MYGEDDRVEPYEVTAELARTARATAIALISPTMLQERSDGSYAVVAPAYATVQSLCPDQRFADQPAAASCSGVLVRPDLVATAGHCLGAGADGRYVCGRTLYVRGFTQPESHASIAIAKDDVFTCKEVIARLKTPAGGACVFDLALVRLDRSADDFASLRELPVEAGEPVVVAGYPAGLPLKLDRGASVIDARLEQGDFFTLNSDTFAVSSGGPIFDLDGELVGIFSRGRRDYDQEGSCQRVHREEEELADGFEEATHAVAIREVLDALEHDTAPVSNADRTCTAAQLLPAQQAATGQAPRPGAGGCLVAAGRPPGAAIAGMAAVLSGVLLARRRRTRQSVCAAHLRGTPIFAPGWQTETKLTEQQSLTVGEYERRHSPSASFGKKSRPTSSSMASNGAMRAVAVSS